MSKGKHGNKEAKKPKQPPVKAPSAEALAATAAVAVPKPKKR